MLKQIEIKPLTKEQEKKMQRLQAFHDYFGKHHTTDGMKEYLDKLGLSEEEVEKKLEAVSIAAEPSPATKNLDDKQPKSEVPVSPTPRAIVAHKARAERPRGHVAVTGKTDFSVAERFGEVIAQDNWGIVPYAFYKYQDELDLSIAEVWFLCWVIMHRWEDKDSFPSLNALARYTGYTRQYIQVIAHRLHERGYIDIKERTLENNAKASNYYDIGPIMELLEIEIKNDENSQYNKRKGGQLGNT